MKQYHQRPDRQSYRLKNYDYTQPASYFVTISTKDNKRLFGEVINGSMKLNDFGHFIAYEWIISFEKRENLKLDEFIVMPDHFHAIIHISDYLPGSFPYWSSKNKEKFGKPIPNSLPTIIRSFKSAASRNINKERNESGKSIWKRNYYERMIWNENDLNNIRRYIINNPRKWNK